MSEKTKFDELKEKFEDGKDYASEVKEEARQRGYSTFNVITILGFGLLVVAATAILNGIDVEEGFNLSTAFDPYKISISFIFLLLGLVGFVLFINLAANSAQLTDVFVAALERRREAVVKIKDRDVFHHYRIGINKKNKLQQWRDLVDSKLIEKYKLRKVIEVVFRTRKRWEVLEKQTTAYVAYVNNEDPKKEAELLQAVGYFNLNNAKVQYKEWKESFFVISSTNADYDPNQTADTSSIITSLATRRIRNKIMVWSFTTIIGSISISSLVYDLNSWTAIIMNLGFIWFACTSGWRESWSAMLSVGVKYIDDHTSFVTDYLAKEDELIAEARPKPEIPVPGVFDELVDKQPQLGEESRTSEMAAFTEWRNSRAVQCKTCYKLGSICDGRTLDGLYESLCTEFEEKKEEDLK